MAPSRTREDYDARTVALVQKTGYTCACSNFDGIITSRSPIYELPRCVVRDWEADTFAKRVRRWYGRTSE